jgi:hypothetical protein
MIPGGWIAAGALLALLAGLMRVFGSRGNGIEIEWSACT